MRSSWLASLTLVAACASPARPEPVSPSPPWGVTLASSSRDALDLDREPVPAQPSTEARQLRAATDELIRAQPEADPRRVSEALRALASVLDRLTPNATSETQQVRAAADDLEHADAVREVRTGLGAARRALATFRPSPPADISLYLVEVAELRDEAMKLDGDLSLEGQYAQVRAAFCAAVRAVYAAEGAEAPTFEQRATTAQR